MLFQYIGGTHDAPTFCDVYDKHFVLNGEPVDVTDERHIKKLMFNKSFLHQPQLFCESVVTQEQPPIRHVEANIIRHTFVNGVEEGDELPETFLGKLAKFVMRTR